jgi:hypothetical protein
MGRGRAGGWSRWGRLTYEQEDSPSFLAQHGPLPDPEAVLLPQHEDEPWAVVAALLAQHDD